MWLLPLTDPGDYVLHSDSIKQAVSCSKVPYCDVVWYSPFILSLVVSSGDQILVWKSRECASRVHPWREQTPSERANSSGRLQQCHVWLKLLSPKLGVANLYNQLCSDVEELFKKKKKVKQTTGMKRLQTLAFSIRTNTYEKSPIGLTVLRYILSWFIPVSVSGTFVFSSFRFYSVKSSCLPSQCRQHLNGTPRNNLDSWKWPVQGFALLSVLSLSAGKYY